MFLKIISYHSSCVFKVVKYLQCKVGYIDLPYPNLVGDEEINISAINSIREKSCKSRSQINLILFHDKYNQYQN